MCFVFLFQHGWASGIVFHGFGLGYFLDGLLLVQPSAVGVLCLLRVAFLLPLQSPANGVNLHRTEKLGQTVENHEYADDDSLKSIETSGIIFNDLKTYSAAINNIHVFDYCKISNYKS